MTADQSETNSLMGRLDAVTFSDVKVHPDSWAAVTTAPLQDSAFTPFCRPRAPTALLGLDHPQYCNSVDSSCSLYHQSVLYIDY